MKANTRALKISIMLLMLIPSIYMLLHKVSILSFLGRLGIGYSPCVESVCISLDREWVVVYNSDSIYEDVISLISSPGYPSMKMARINENGSIDRVIFSLIPAISDSILNKPEYMRKNYPWGKAVILSSGNQSKDDMAHSIFLSDYNVFVSSNYDGIVDDINLITDNK